jgi:hypothetical protein
VVDWQLQYSIVATVIAPAYIIVVLFADPDSRKLGRALLRGAIPREFSKPDFNVGEEIWILFDHQGPAGNAKARAVKRRFSPSACGVKTTPSSNRRAPLPVLECNEAMRFP